MIFIYDVKCHNDRQTLGNNRPFRRLPNVEAPPLSAMVGVGSGFSRIAASELLAGRGVSQANPGSAAGTALLRDHEDLAGHT